MHDTDILVILDGVRDFGSRFFSFPYFLQETFVLVAVVGKVGQVYVEIFLGHHAVGCVLDVIHNIYV